MLIPSKRNEPANVIERRERRIVDADRTLATARHTAAESYVANYWPAGVTRFDPLSAAKGMAENLAARVNHGRWIVQCDNCHGAQLASRTDRRFFCTDCLNSAQKGRWRYVNWPSKADTAAIEEALAPRPIANRNWEPGETIDRLLTENVVYGVTDTAGRATD